MWDCIDIFDTIGVLNWHFVKMVTQIKRDKSDNFIFGPKKQFKLIWDCIGNFKMLYMGQLEREMKI